MPTDHARHRLETALHRDCRAAHAGALFSHVERATLDVAVLDSRHAGAGHSRLVTWLGRVFRAAQPQPLADPRLEALRVYAISLLRNAEDFAARDALAATGYGAEQFAVLRLALATPRAASGDRAMVH